MWVTTASSSPDTTTAPARICASRCAAQPPVRHVPHTAQAGSAGAEPMDASRPCGGAPSCLRPPTHRLPGVPRDSQALAGQRGLVNLEGLALANELRTAATATAGCSLPAARRGAVLAVRDGGGRCAACTRRALAAPCPTLLSAGMTSPPLSPITSPGTSSLTPMVCHLPSRRQWQVGADRACVQRKAGAWPQGRAQQPPSGLAGRGHRVGWMPFDGLDPPPATLAPRCHAPLARPRRRPRCGPSSSPSTPRTAAPG